MESLLHGVALARYTGAWESGGYAQRILLDVGIVLESCGVEIQSREDYEIEAQRAHEAWEREKAVREAQREQERLQKRAKNQARNARRAARKAGA